MWPMMIRQPQNRMRTETLSRDGDVDRCKAKLFILFTPDLSCGGLLQGSNASYRAAK